MPKDVGSRGVELTEPDPALPGEEGEDAESLLATLRRLSAVLDRERGEAPVLCAELLALPQERREERLAADPRFHTWGVCEILLTRSAESDAAEGARLALLALSGADLLDPVQHAAPVVADLKARAWAATGEALRRQRKLAGAEEALRAAASCLAQGTGDLLVEARLLEFEAAVRREQGRSGEAAALLKLAAARYRETGETQRLERVLAERGDLLRQGAAAPASRPLF